MDHHDDAFGKRGGAAPPAGPALLSGLSLVMPAYNEAASLEAAAIEALAAAAAMARDVELCVVDDGSTDDTAAIATRLSEMDRRVNVIRHDRNLGYGAAVWRGLKAAAHEVVVLTPADRQYDLRDLRRLVELIDRHDIAVGRRGRRAESLGRRINARAWSWLVRTLLGAPVRDINSGLKVFRRSALEGMSVRSTGAMFDAELLTRAHARGASIVETPVTHLPRVSGAATGARLDVIARSFVDLARLYPELRALRKLKVEVKSSKRT